MARIRHPTVPTDPHLEPIHVDVYGTVPPDATELLAARLSAVRVDGPDVLVGRWVADVGS